MCDAQGLMGHKKSWLVSHKISDFIPGDKELIDVKRFGWEIIYSILNVVFPEQINDWVIKKPPVIE